MTEDVFDISTAPGLILKTARDELKLSVEQVAHELHLRASVVRAMEQEQYEEFSSDVFLKGYFRSYCRLVGLHEERMVELLEKQLCSRKIEKDNSAALEKKALKLIARKKAIVVLLLLSLIIGISLYIVSEFIGSGKNSDPEDVVSVVSPESSASKLVNEQNNSSLTNVNSLSSSTPKNDTNKPEVSKIPSTTTEKGKTGGPEQDKTELEDKALNESMLQQGVAVNQYLTKKEKQIVQNALGSSSFDASFTGDCWFTLKNAKGKTVFAALKHAGDTVAYSGLAPYQVVLGDASKVVLVFEGQKVNLNPYTARNGRAEFTLESR